MLANSDVWPDVGFAIFAGAVLLGTAAMYIRHSTSLANFIDRRCPDLWDKLYLRDFIGATRLAICPPPAIAGAF